MGAGDAGAGSDDAGVEWRDCTGFRPRRSSAWTCGRCAGGASSSSTRGVTPCSTGGGRCRRRGGRRPAEVERVLRLYRERYRGFNVRHFYEIARREHAVRLSYSWVKDALQLAGLVPKHRARGRHRRRREPRACFGELLHIDGSPHAWFALAPDAAADVDHGARRCDESACCMRSSGRRKPRVAVMTALAGGRSPRYGLPMALYSDRARWAFHTPTAKGPVDKTHLTQVGRALAHLGVEHIPAYSPQARGRSERLNRTLQDRLVNELRVAGIDDDPRGQCLSAGGLSAAAQCAPSAIRRATRSRRGSPSATSISTRSSAIRRPARSRRTTPSTLDRVVLQVAKQPGAPHLRRPRGRRAASSRRPAFRLARARNGSGLFDATGRPVDAATAVHGRQTGRAPAVWTGPRRPRPAHSAHRRHFSESGQITC